MVVRRCLVTRLELDRRFDGLFEGSFKRSSRHSFVERKRSRRSLPSTYTPSASVTNGTWISGVPASPFEASDVASPDSFLPSSSLPEMQRTMTSPLTASSKARVDIGSCQRPFFAVIFTSVLTRTRVHGLLHAHASATLPRSFRGRSPPNRHPLECFE